MLQGHLLLSGQLIQRCFYRSDILHHAKDKPQTTQISHNLITQIPSADPGNQQGNQPDHAQLIPSCSHSYISLS